MVGNNMEMSNTIIKEILQVKSYVADKFPNKSIAMVNYEIGSHVYLKKSYEDLGRSFLEGTYILTRQGTDDSTDCWVRIANEKGELLIDNGSIKIEEVLDTQSENLVKNKTIAVAIDGLQVQINANKEDITRLEALINQNVSDIATIKEQLNTDDKRMDEHDKHIVKNERDIESANAVAVNHEQRIGESENAIVALQSRASATESTTASHGSAIREHSTAINEIKQTNTQQGSDISKNANDITAIGERVTANENAISEHTTTIGEHTSSIEQINGTLNTQSQSIGSVEERINQAEAVATEQGKKIESNTQGIATASASVQDHETRLAKAEKDVSDISGKVNTNTTAIATQTTKVSGLETKVNTLDKAVETATSPINVKGTLNAVSELPKSGNKGGDMYFVKTASNTYDQHVWVTTSASSGEWKIVGNTNVAMDVVDNTTTDSDTKALSARQGMIISKQTELANTIANLNSDVLQSSMVFNLFNNNDIIDGYYLSTTGKLSNFDGSAITKQIPIKGGKVYSIHTDGKRNGNCFMVFIDADGQILEPLNPLNNQTIPIPRTFRETLIKAPTDAKYFQMTIKWPNDNVDYSNSLTILESIEYIPRYIPYGDVIINIDSLPKEFIDDINSRLDTKVSAELIKSKNLFNKNDIQMDMGINYSINVVHNPLPFKGSVLSSYIPIEPNGTYYLERNLTSAAGDAVFCFADKNYNSLLPLDPITNEELSNKEFVGLSRAYKAPANAKYAIFCIKRRNFTSADLIGVQLEKGDKFTGYEDFYEYSSVPYSKLPKDLYGLSDRVKVLENNSNVVKITIANSDKIGYFSNSFLNGYCMLNHHAINNISMFSDYIHYNYGQSGADLLELLVKIDKNERWLGSIPVQQWGIKYGIIAMQDNDGALYAYNADTYYHNAKNMAEAIKAMGGIPILATEHDVSRYYYAFDRLAQEQGLMMINFGKKANYFAPRTPYRRYFEQFWKNGHPSTRTAWLWTNGMLPYLNTLPRPTKVIKLFRVRDFVDTSNVQNLVYDSNYSRAEKFVELTCGCSSFTKATEKNFDRLNLDLTESLLIQDEYQKIQNKEDVLFGNNALIEVITPYDRNNLQMFNIHINGSGIVKAFCKSAINFVRPLPDKRYYAFGVTNGIELLTKGTAFTISGIAREDGVGLNREFIVKDTYNGIVITTTGNYDISVNGATSGTDTPICSIDGVTMEGSYDYPDADYMKRYDKPYGEWKEVSIENGVIVLDKTQINDFTNFDKVSILLQGNGITINDIQCNVGGNNIKNNMYSLDVVRTKKGQSRLQKTSFTNNDTEWVGISDLEDYIPITNVAGDKSEFLPEGIENVKILNKGQSVYQLVTPTESVDYSDLENQKMQVKVIARYFPKYVKTDEDWQTSEITEQSFDCAKLKISAMDGKSDTNPISLGEIYVGAWWNEYYLNFDFYGDLKYLKLECSDKHVQIAKCDLIKVD